MPHAPAHDRPPLAGPPTPQPPYPIPLSGPIIKGFGRGSSELGIPTANIPLAGLSVGGHEELESGVYYGWCGVGVDEEGNKLGTDKEEEEGGHTLNGSGVEPVKVAATKHADNNPEEEATMTIAADGGTIFPMVMSLGYNPYYKNTVRSIEVHILHAFPRDFYGARMNLLICGYVRPEYDYVSMEALVRDIRTDIEVARRSLGREGYGRLVDRGGKWWGGLADFARLSGEEVERAEGVARGGEKA